MKRQGRFAVGIGVILASLGYFAFVGYQEGRAYYKTIDEVAAMGDDAVDTRLRVAGVVQPGSIERDGKELTFTLTQLVEDVSSSMVVAYTGSQPIPDTFKDGADAIVEGHRRTDGTFAADHIQAKCASKYEAKYGSSAQHPSQVPMSGAADSASGGSY
ncbi:MAG: cytochrome c maturation protein CcmE [Candidatus Latescibacteria bacterium]|nr:cytochrome c maturation protein CcmE [Candidatus Latescibacterota bacterium]